MKSRTNLKKKYLIPNYPQTQRIIKNQRTKSIDRINERQKNHKKIYNEVFHLELSQRNKETIKQRIKKSFFNIGSNQSTKRVFDKHLNLQDHQSNNKNIKKGLIKNEGLFLKNPCQKILKTKGILLNIINQENQKLRMIKRNKLSSIFDIQKQREAQKKQKITAQMKENKKQFISLHIQSQEFKKPNDLLKPQSYKNIVKKIRAISAFQQEKNLQKDIITKKNDLKMCRFVVNPFNTIERKRSKSLKMLKNQKQCQSLNRQSIFSSQQNKNIFELSLISCIREVSFVQNHDVDNQSINLDIFNFDQ